MKKLLLLLTVSILSLSSAFAQFERSPYVHIDQSLINPAFTQPENTLDIDFYGMVQSNSSLGGNFGDVSLKYGFNKKRSVVHLSVLKENSVNKALYTAAGYAHSFAASDDVNLFCGYRIKLVQSNDFIYNPKDQFTNDNNAQWGIYYFFFQNIGMGFQYKNLRCGLSIDHFKKTLLDKEKRARGFDDEVLSTSIDLLVGYTYNINDKLKWLPQLNIDYRKRQYYTSIMNSIDYKSKYRFGICYEFLPSPEMLEYKRDPFTGFLYRNEDQLNSSFYHQFSFVTSVKVWDSIQFSFMLTPDDKRIDATKFFLQLKYMI